MKGEAKNIDAEEESRRRNMAEKIGKEDFIQRISLSGHQQTHPGALQEIDARPHVPWPAQQVNPLAHRKKHKASTQRGSIVAPCLHPIASSVIRLPAPP